MELVALRTESGAPQVVALRKESGATPDTAGGTPALPFQLSLWDETNSCQFMHHNSRQRTAHMGIKLVAGFGEANSCLKFLDSVWD